MYEAKRAGRGRLVFYHESMEDAARSRAQIQGELKHAIDARQLRLRRLLLRHPGDERTCAHLL